MRSCREPSCIGWPLLSSDQYCSWCGCRLVEVEAGFESKLGDEWVALHPPVLNRERPPSLRLKVSHSGEAGHLRLTPADFRLSAPWLDLDYSSLGDAPLKPGDSVHFPVKKLKVPGPEDLAHEIRVLIGLQEIRASSSLTFVPAPEFYLELTSHEIVLSSDADPYVEGALVVRRGRVWLESPPRLDPAWAELIGPDGENDFELDALERPRYPFRFRIPPEELALLRQRSADPGPLVRKGQIRFTYLDRGQKGSGPHRESLQGSLPVSLQFLLAPELYLEPFGYEPRRDWLAVLGLRQAPYFALTVHNGPPGSAPRQDLVIQQLRVREADGLEEFPVEGPEPPPWKVVSDSPLQLRLRLPQSWRKQEAALDRRLQLVPISNDPIQRLFHLRFQAQPAEPFPGYLVVDLGTSSTCAALVDESKAIERVNFERRGELPSAACYLRWSGERRWEIGAKALQRSLEPAAQRAVVMQAKRQVGSDFVYEVVPLDEPSETFSLSPGEALSHLYREALDQALQHRLASGSGEVLVERLLITHPSRFSLRQVEVLRQAAVQALRDHWKHWSGRERTDLPAPITLHEPTGAAFYFLRDWRQLRQVHELLQTDQANWHLLVYDLGGGTLDVTLMRLESLQQACEGEGFAYQVSPRVIGATGERWFGGQDVTLRLLDLISARLDQALESGWQFPREEAGPAQKVAWQRNRSLLEHWCEELKLALVQGQGEEAWARFPGLSVWEGSRERLVTASHWRQQVALPSLEELETAIAPLLSESRLRIEEMLERHGVRPEVVLRVGKASQLPSIEAHLRDQFPQSLLLAPEQLKGCVVEGACLPSLPGLPSGIQLSRGLRRPGVRFRWDHRQSYNATTCRLGLQILDSGETWFQQVLAEGTPIPAEGLKGELDSLYLDPGPTTLVILENAGHRDEVLQAGRLNPDIQVLARCPIEVPTLDWARQEQFRLRFELGADGTLCVRLDAPEWEGLEVARFDSSQLGRLY